MYSSGFLRSFFLFLYKMFFKISISFLNNNYQQHAVDAFNMRLLSASVRAAGILITLVRSAAAAAAAAASTHCPTFHPQFIRMLGW